MTRIQAQAHSVEAVESEDGKTKTIHGTAVVYDVVGHFPFFRATLAPKSLADSLAARKGSKDRDALALISHDPSKVIGRVHNGTLRFQEQSDRLTYAIDINKDDPEALSVWAKVKRGDMSAASVGIDVLEAEFEDMKDNGLDADSSEADEDGNVEVLRITAADLVEVSIVGHGAFGGATAEVEARELQEKLSEELRAQFSDGSNVITYQDVIKEDKKDEDVQPSEEAEATEEGLGELVENDVDEDSTDTELEGSSEDNTGVLRADVKQVLIAKGILTKGDFNGL